MPAMLTTIGILPPVISVGTVGLICFTPATKDGASPLSTPLYVGAFACQLVMFYRRKLPPWHPDLTEATFLFVTWRLAGSIPRARPLAGAHRRKSIRGPSLLVLDREVDKAAFGPVWLQDARVARVVAEALLYSENGRHFYQLRAWVITRWLKGSTARPANLILGRTGEAFWQDESFDHRVRDEAELGLVHYVEYNPVSAGVAANPVPGLGRAQGWQAKAPAPQLARSLPKCRKSRGRTRGRTYSPKRCARRSGPSAVATMLITKNAAAIIDIVAA